jgi:hypothetical protein
MKRKNRDSGDRLPDFVPLFRETSGSPAYKACSFGARALFMALSGYLSKTNNGRVYLSQRNAEEELGHTSRNDIANWFRELQHYGLIVQTKGASLGVDGKGKATHWRLTDRPTRTADGQLNLATKDFLHWDGKVFEPHVAPSRRWSARKAAALQKQNPGLHVATKVDCTSSPEVGCTSQPPKDGSGMHVQSISADRGGMHVQSVTSLPLGGPQTEPEPGEVDLVDDDAEDGMIQIEHDGELIWVPSQNDEQWETA